MRIAWNKDVAIVAMPFLLGMAAFFLIVRPQALRPTNIAWLSDYDQSQHYLGWHFFRNADWSFPIGLNPDYGLELSSAIVFSDSNPLLAFLFKPFSSLLPEPFQYFGLWLLVCFVLQAWLAWKLVGLVSRHLAVRLLGAGLFVLAPPMIWRMQVHSSLAGHFLILAALYLSLRPTRRLRTTGLAIVLVVAAPGASLFVGAGRGSVAGRLGSGRGPARAIRPARGAGARRDLGNGRACLLAVRLFHGGKWGFGKRVRPVSNEPALLVGFRWLVVCIEGPTGSKVRRLQLSRSRGHHVGPLRVARADRRAGRFSGGDKAAGDAAGSFDGHLSVRALPRDRDQTAGNQASAARTLVASRERILLFGADVLACVLWIGIDDHLRRRSRPQASDRHLIACRCPHRSTDRHQGRMAGNPKQADGGTRHGMGYSIARSVLGPSRRQIPEPSFDTSGELSPALGSARGLCRAAWARHGRGLPRPLRSKCV